MKQKFFRTECDESEEAGAAQAIREIHWSLFWHYTQPAYDTEDIDSTIDRITSATGWKRGFVRQAIFGHSRLQDLPRLRHLQAHSQLLDVPRLGAINAELEELGPGVEQEVYDQFDDLLVDLFTPKRANQHLPGVKSITTRIRALVKKIDPSRAYDPKKREDRSTDRDDKLTFDEFLLGGMTKARMELLTNSVTLKRIRAHVAATAREHGTSLHDTAVKLLTGEIVPSTNVTLHAYTPKDRAAGDPVFIPGCGWTNPEDTDAFEEWLENVDPAIVDLDAAGQQEVQGYKPTEAMRHAVIARDGTCIYPGCAVPAERCQLDHRIPYEDGGATTADNLYSLCQHHHNVKTDRRAFYFPDPHTGDILWCFADGTYEIVAPEGLIHDQITPTTPRWQSSLQSARNNRARVAEFNAKGHTILDAFDQDQDLAKAELAILALEEEYGMEFPFKPELPWEPPLPEEPVEAPFSEEEEIPGENPFHEKSFVPESFVEWHIALAHCRQIMDMVEEAV